MIHVEKSFIHQKKSNMFCHNSYIFWLKLRLLVGDENKELPNWKSQFHQDFAQNTLV